MPHPFLLADLFSRGNYSSPLEISCEEVSTLAEAHGLVVGVHAFTEMTPGQNLREHAHLMQAQGVRDGHYAGPWMEVRMGP